MKPTRKEILTAALGALIFGVAVNVPAMVWGGVPLWKALVIGGAIIFVFIGGVYGACVIGRRT